MNTTTMYFIKDSYTHSSKPQMKRITVAAAAAAAAAMRAKSFRNETWFCNSIRMGVMTT
jgi:hypothetical protein